VRHYYVFVHNIGSDHLDRCRVDVEYIDNNTGRKVAFLPRIERKDGKTSFAPKKDPRFALSAGEKKQILIAWMNEKGSDIGIKVRTDGGGQGELRESRSYSVTVSAFGGPAAIRANYSMSVEGGRLVVRLA
jgi:hypothetical protein